jgi:SEL1 protein
MALNGLATIKDCQTAVKFFKSVTEKGVSANMLDDGYHAFLNTKHRDSLLHYLQSSDLGYETAQLNAAYLLEKEHGDEILGEYNRKTTYVDLCFKYYKMLADQGNVMAMVKVGDYYYYGYGTNVSIAKSLVHYRKAGDFRNAQALFNLAYMYENGEGLTKDYYLAKRFYDMSRDASKEAYLPVVLALGWLYAKWGYQMVWNQELRAGLVIPNIREMISIHEDWLLYALIILFGFLLIIRYLLSPRRNRPE